ncbi:DedA family protein [Candidatus Woesearchaeota archaeon]|nr:DedA family protein [Candidatus Woesearchaeota archaeon]
MNPLMQFIDLILHLDKYLNIIIANYGVWTYVLLFLIIFCETGLVIMPFLPGDSLLFVAGVFAANGSLDISLLFSLLALAAILGDTINYWIGNVIGEKIVHSGRLRFIKKEHIQKTETFYHRYGGRAIILARFVPIVRTFAPFVAGAARMNYMRFATYNVVGAGIWVGLFTFGGYYFGNIPLVKDNFSIAILVIIFASLVPAIWEYVKHRKQTHL